MVGDMDAEEAASLPVELPPEADSIINDILDEESSARLEGWRAMLDAVKNQPEGEDPEVDARFDEADAEEDEGRGD